MSRGTAPRGMSWAIGDRGVELARDEDVVEIGVVPLGPGNLVVPATVVWRARGDGAQMPAKVTAVLEAGSTTALGNVRSFPCIEFDRRNGEYGACALCRPEDAEHAIFAALPSRDRARVRNAWQTFERSRAVSP